MKRKLNSDDVPEAVPEEKEKPSEVTKPTFSSFGLDARLLQAVTKEKFSVPTPVQTKAIPLALGGQDVLARAKTGSGKTLAYLLPTLHTILRRKAASNASAKSSKQTTALILVPTKELAAQVYATMKTLTSFCGDAIQYENLTRKEELAVTRAKLAWIPDLVVATPSRAWQWINSEDLKVDGLKHLVIDEADLVLSYGYEDDLKSISEAMPSYGVQVMLLSATLHTTTTTLTELFCKSTKPTILDLAAEESAEKLMLAQYVVRTAEEDKFLLIYAIFKLQLIKGKIIVFVADIDRCYRIKLFLEQFALRSCVLNSELPVNSRLHAVEEFNRGVYDILIAADEGEVVGEEGGGRKKRQKFEQEAGDEDEVVEDGVEDTEAASKLDPVENGDHPDSAATTTTKSKAKPERKRSKRKGEDREYGVSRGIDFRNVSCVLNFDLPTTAKSYTHRVGRTARAGQTGMALSFYVPKELYRKHKPTTIAQCANDEEVLAKVKAKEDAKGRELKEWAFDMAKLEPFRYRFADALRSVTRIAIREARTRELKRELINSTKLQQHFEENPEELRHLRHDNEGASGRTIRVQSHLKHVPDYLLPQGGKRAVAQDVGFVGIRGDKERKRNRGKGWLVGREKGRSGKRDGIGMGKPRSKDPLRSLSVRGRGK